MPPRKRRSSRNAPHDPYAAVGPVIAGVGAGIVALGIALHARNAEASIMRVNTSTKLADLRGEYAAMYAAATVKPESIATVDHIVTTLASHRNRYDAASRTSGVPWYVIAAIHSLEGGGQSGDFSRHLHNGDPLTAQTTHIPAHRPAAPPASGKLPYTWEESAADALSRWRGVTDWSLPATLWRLEGYNGFGTRARGLPSPYLWSYTDQYVKGKYVADGVWDANAVSRQVGAAAILKRMEQRGIIAIPT